MNYKNDNQNRRSTAVRNRRKSSRLRRLLKILIFLLLLLLAFYACTSLGILGSSPNYLKTVDVPEWVDEQFIRVDGASRRGIDLKKFSGVVIHYVGNPGSTAQQNRDYFNSPESNVSSHFIVGLDGEIIQCVPLWEISSASNNKNSDTISIEVCHPDKSGKFTDASYHSLVRLTAWLCKTGHLNTGDVIRHYDITGKLCPIYYVKHPDAWKKLKTDIAAAM